MAETVAILEYPADERVTNPGLDQEWLNQRTEQALDDCDFVRTPELEKGIKGFYDTHYQLASLMRLGLGEQEMTDEDQKEYLNGIIDSSYFSRDEIDNTYKARMQGYGVYSPYAQQVTPMLARLRLARLENPADTDIQKAELSALSEAGSALFAEASVGVTTLREPEADLIYSLRTNVANQMVESGLFPHLNSGSDASVSDPFLQVNKAIETFRRDTRFAGQLMFHNTGHFDQLSASGEVMPRRMQLQRNGEVNVQTAETLNGHVHSPTPHWSESFDPRNYRGSRAERTGGTVAVPIAKIIESAPYGRDAQYDILTLKPEAAAYMVDSIHLNNSVADIGYGGQDVQGGAGTDRTFYSSPHDSLPTDGLESAPDGYTIPLDKESYWVQIKDEDEGKVWASEDIPEQYEIPVEPFQGEFRASNVEAIKAWREQRSRTIARSIRQLQDQSIQRYPNEVVAPIRAGVMDFHVPDDGAPMGKKRAQFTKLAQ